MESRLEDDDVVGVDEIDESVLLVDSPGPATSQDMAQRLWFADAGHRIAKNLVQKSVEPVERPLVRPSGGVGLVELTW